MPVFLRFRVRWSVFTVIGPLLMAGTPAHSAAQAGGGDGYLFGQPSAVLSLRIGLNQPNASSDVFRQFNHDLTLSRSDYLAPSLMLDVAVPLSSHSELVLAGGVAGSTASSEFRAFVDNDDMPIEQATTFLRVPISIGLKWNFIPSGRQVGQLAWVPSKFVPYVAVGGGVMRYSLRQSGDFIDFNNMQVFNTTISSSGWGGMGYAAMGATLNLRSWLGYTTEVRYDSGNAALRGDFRGFDRVALSGAGVTTGLTFRF